MIYTDKIVALYHQANLEPLFSEGNAIQQYVYGDELSGLQIIFQIKWMHGRIESCRYKVFGCGYTIALCVWLEEYLIGKSKENLDTMELVYFINEFDLPKTKHKVAIALLNVYQQILTANA